MTQLSLTLAGLAAATLAAAPLAAAPAQAQTQTQYDQDAANYQAQQDRYADSNADYQARQARYMDQRAAYQRERARYARARDAYDARWGYGAYERIHGYGPDPYYYIHDQDDPYFWDGRWHEHTRAWYADHPRD